MAKNRIPILIFIPMLGILFSSSLQAKGISQEEAMRMIQNLPEVQAFQKEIEKSGLKGTLLIYPDPEKPDPTNRYHEFYVGESLRDHTNRWNTFGVNKGSGEIFVRDPLKGKYLPYAQWQKSH